MISMRAVKPSRCLRDPKITEKLFGELAERYKKRPGGYTRVLKAGFPLRRHGADGRSSSWSTAIRRPRAWTQVRRKSTRSRPTEDED